MGVVQVKEVHKLWLVFGVLMCLVACATSSLRDGMTQAPKPTTKLPDKHSMYYPDDLNYDYDYEEDDDDDKSLADSKPITHHHHIHIHIKDPTTTRSPSRVTTNSTSTKSPSKAPTKTIKSTTGKPQNKTTTLKPTKTIPKVPVKSTTTRYPSSRSGLGRDKSGTVVEQLEPEDY